MDGEGWNPPLGQVEIPTIQSDPAEMVAGILAALRAVATGTEVTVNPACAQRKGEPWVALVTVYVGETSWMMSDATACRLARFVEADLRFDLMFGEVGKLAGMLASAADHARAMARGAVKFNPGREGLH